MSGKKIGRVVGDAPLITAVDKTAGLNAVAWRGTAGADGYRIQRSVLGGGWKTVSGGTRSMRTTPPWLDRPRSPPAPATGCARWTRTGGWWRRRRGRRRPEHRGDVDPLEDWFGVGTQSRACDARRPHGCRGGAGGGEDRLDRVPHGRPDPRRGLHRLRRRPRPTVRVLVADRWRTVIPLVTGSASGDWTVSVSAAVRRPSRSAGLGRSRPVRADPGVDHRPSRGADRGAWCLHPLHPDARGGRCQHPDADHLVGRRVTPPTTTWWSPSTRI